LSLLSKEKCFLCEPNGQAFKGNVPSFVTRVGAAMTHPQGLAGFLVHRHFPAQADAPVWSIHAEDLADIGAFLTTGYLPATRLVSITGDALRAPRLVRCQKGADLRGLSQSLVKPGPHDVMSGSLLDGRPAHWLAPHDRQITVHERAAKQNKTHWFKSALERAARHAPIIPTAALDQAFGGAFPAAAFIRALASGDAETFIQLGGLSLVEEDLALADYATGARPRLAKQLRAMLTRIAAEEDAL
jgi:Na+-transporting NADH:ubiquinone oxidoreductase subunit A